MAETEKQKEDREKEIADKIRELDSLYISHCLRYIIYMKCVPCILLCEYIYNM